MRKRILDKVIIIDLESTCWEPYDATQVSEIIEIGYCILKREQYFMPCSKIPLDGVIWSVEEKGTYIVKPKNTKVSEFCTQLTSLTQEDVDKGVDLLEALQDMKDKFKLPRMTWVSWGDYDRKQFIRELGYSTYCSFFGTHINLKNMFSLMEGHPKEYGMAEALVLSGRTLEGRHHRGIDDAYNIGKIWSWLFNTRYP